MTLNRQVAALAGGVALALMAFAASPSLSEPAEVTIVHFNDLDRMSERRGRGGVARLAAVINSERERGGNVLVTFGGDTISPSLMSGLDEGAHMIDLLNRLDLTAMAIGNHEFDFGPEVAKQRISEANFPILGANHMDKDGEVIDGAQESIIVDAGKYKIGIFGLTTVGTAVKSSPGDVTFRDAAEVAAEQAAALRDAGANLVIALAHTDRDEDRALIEQGAVDLLLSGDDHMLRTEFSGDVLFAESGEQADWVTVIDLELNEREDDGEMEFFWSGEYRVVDTARFAPDMKIEAAVEAFEQQLSEELDVVLGTTSTALDSRRETIRAEEAAIANMFADALRDATGADVGIMNGGGIRANRTYDPGAELSRRDIQSELPFGNKTVVLEVTGQDIIDALENGLSQIENGSGRFPHVSGIEVQYDPSKPAGSRIVEVTMGGNALDPAATFSLAINNFLANGGDGYDMLEGKRRIVDEYAAVLMTVQVFDYISERGTVSPAVDGRLKTVQ